MTCDYYSMKRNQNIQGFFKRKKSKTTEQDRAAEASSASQSEDESQLDSARDVQQEPPASAVHMDSDKDTGDEGPSSSLAHQGVSSQPLSDNDTDTENHPAVPAGHAVTRGDGDAAALVAPPGPHDISQSRAAGPSQPRLKVFPRTLQGEKRRAFNPVWFNHNSWLEYSQSKDSAYCYACRHFSLPGASESVFSSESGFSHWEKATYKDAGFKLHEKSESHINAMFAWNEHKRLLLTGSSILDMINKEYKKKVEENRSYIKTVADVLLLTATQNIAQRGHRESEEYDNKGNFLGILEMIAKHNPMVAQKMKGQRNAKYTSNTIQNEILQCLASMVRDEIVKEVKESVVFSVIADETKDLKRRSSCH
ncbi:uncharacterized protein LOC130203930 [Pseudoliparis swirei]|uniref:uncharacterized protein LOC130203930 n=1 Tax=Pseudoliparis swirei TaxID=2059687 RepID=UPI0024BDB03A|nr:uncharacterized protein LOC130203930 [Pseudoliparis swirei]